MKIGEMPIGKSLYLVVGEKKHISANAPIWFATSNLVVASDPENAKEAFRKHYALEWYVNILSVSGVIEGE